MQTVCLTVGDWSGDGHRITSDYYIESNLTGEEIEKAYELGSEVLGFNLCNEVCEYYEDNQISDQHLEKLIQSGFNPPSDFEKDWVGCKNYTKMYLHVVSLGNPSFKFEFVKADTVNIGGYGTLS